MIRKGYIVFILSGLGLLTLSFSVNNQLKIPYKKIKKTVKKQFGIQEFFLQEKDGLTNPYSDSEILSVKTDTFVIGYVFVRRVNSCRMGGCSISRGDLADEFEYFDYYLVTNSVGRVLNVKVFNYQATHGHEVMSKGWLKQFVGFDGTQNLVYGKDIQAISGATISAKSIIEDIQNAEAQIKNMLDDYVSVH